MLGYFIKPEGTLSKVFVQFEGKSLIDVVLNLELLNLTDAVGLIIVIMLFVAVALDIAIIVGGHVNITKIGTGKVLKIMSFVFFVLVVALAITVVAKSNSVTAGMAIVVLISLFVFFVNIITEKKKV